MQYIAPLFNYNKSKQENVEYFENENLVHTIILFLTEGNNYFQAINWNDKEYNSKRKQQELRNVSKIPLCGQNL